jgi:hypothetical protein
MRQSFTVYIENHSIISIKIIFLRLFLYNPVLQQIEYVSSTFWPQWGRTDKLFRFTRFVRNLKDYY